MVDNYSLRPLMLTDSDRIFTWRNSEAVRLHMFSDQPFARKEHERWMERTVAGEGCFYRLFSQGKKPLGLIGLKAIDSQHGRADWGFYLGELERPHGAGTAMMLGFMQLAFEQLRLRKLCASVLAHNEGSLHLHKKLGFAEEGVLKSHWLRTGSYEDVHLFAYFAADWQKNKHSWFSLLSQVTLL